MNLTDTISGGMLGGKNLTAKEVVLTGNAAIGIGLLAASVFLVNALYDYSKRKKRY